MCMILTMPGIGSSTLERVQGHSRGELAAAHREAQTVAGHGIDEARGVAGKQQAWHTARRRLDAQRSEAHRTRDRARVSETARESRVRTQRVEEQLHGLLQRAAVGSDDTRVDETTWKRRNADVSIVP